MTMRDRWKYFQPVLGYLGLLVCVFGVLMLLPLAAREIFAEEGRAKVAAWVFWVPAVAALAIGVIFTARFRAAPLDSRRAMILCALGWIVITAIGAVPFCLALDIGYLDAYFETMSGFTTTGITMLVGLDRMPVSILFWRTFTQWLGGLGILTFFLAVLYIGRSAHRLFGAESHKVFSRRPAPSLFRTLRILWLIYATFTVLTGVALLLAGMTPMDAFLHAMASISTGGYSPHDASIAFFRQAAYPNYVLIEYTIIVAMLLGGINFFVHYRLLTGNLRSLWDSLEMRLWWGLLAGAVVIVAASRFLRFGLGEGGWGAAHEIIRSSLFHVVSIATTTGFVTEDIGSPIFPAAAKQVFLVLMVIGGCVGSTSGGLKMLRVGVLYKMFVRQIRRLVSGPSAVQPIIVDGESIDDEELRRIAALMFGWIMLIVFGALVTALLSNYGTLASASGMFSAVGNIGPCYIPASTMVDLHWAVKIVYILGMLAGRLEILPLLLLFSPRTWR